MVEKYFQEEEQKVEKFYLLNFVFCYNWKAEIQEILKLSESLKKSEDFKKVYDEKKSYANKYLVVYLKENGLNRNRLGISVSKKVGNSVVRHRLKRLVKESFRLNEEKFLDGYDIVVVLRNAAKDKSYKEIESALLHLGKCYRKGYGTI